MSLLEHVVPGDWAMVRRNFERLMTAVIDTGGRYVGVRWGTDTTTHTASQYSAVKDVNHGLSRTPAVVLVQVRSAHIIYAVTGRDATKFSVQSGLTSGTTTNTFTFDWLVIG